MAYPSCGLSASIAYAKYKYNYVILSVAEGSLMYYNFFFFTTLTPLF